MSLDAFSTCLSHVISTPRVFASDFTLAFAIPLSLSIFTWIRLRWLRRRWSGAITPTIVLLIFLAYSSVVHTTIRLLAIRALVGIVSAQTFASIVVPSASIVFTLGWVPGWVSRIRLQTEIFANCRNSLPLDVESVDSPGLSRLTIHPGQLGLGGESMVEVARQLLDRVGNGPTPLLVSHLDPSPIPRARCA